MSTLTELQLKIMQRELPKLHMIIKNLYEKFHVEKNLIIGHKSDRL